ncbi:hypothetical protein VoSk93_49490 [Vibrio owensii]
MLNESIYSFVKFFQYESISEKAASFNGVRGNALAANLFFGLASMYGLAMILFFHYIEVRKINTFLKVIIFSLLFIGGALAGRTSYIGLFFGLVYYLLNQLDIKVFVYRFTVIIISVLFATFSVYYVLPFISGDELISRVIDYAFEFVINYFDGQGVNTRSTDRLYEMVTVNIGTERQILYGHGLYTGNDGAYYLHTDSGYIRQMLYWGLLGSLCLISFFIFNLLLPFVLRKFKACFFKHDLSCIFVICLYILVLQIKGEVIFHMHMMTLFLYMYGYFIYRDLKRVSR